MPVWTIREAGIDELDRLIALRRKMFESMRIEDAAALDRTCAAARIYFAEHMPTGAFHAYVGADERDNPIASIGWVVHSTPPSPHNLVGKVGYVMNLVTLPQWRRRGIARALLEHVLGVLREQGIPVASLHASAKGRQLYEDLGFEVRAALPEMRIRLHPSSSTNSIPSGK